MDERVPLPQPEDAPEDAEGPLEEPGEAEAADPSEQGEELKPRPRRRPKPAPELTIEEQRRQLEEETGERESMRRRHTRRPAGDNPHFG